MPTGWSKNKARLKKLHQSKANVLSPSNSDGSNYAKRFFASYGQRTLEYVIKQESCLGNSSITSFLAAMRQTWLQMLMVISGLLERKGRRSTRRRWPIIDHHVPHWSCCRAQWPYFFLIEGKEEKVRIQRDFFKAGGLCTWIDNMHDQECIHDRKSMGGNDTVYCQGVPEFAGCER